MKVAYQGSEGAFSHEACLQFLPGYEPVAYPTFADVIAAVERHDAGRGILPLANNEAGETGARDLIDRAEVEIVEQMLLPVRMHLLGLPSARLGQVRTVVSHPIALRQCALALGDLGVKTEEASNTALAAKALANPGRAVLASQRAAEIHGLKILKRDMQDRADNATWFAILARSEP